MSSQFLPHCGQMPQVSNVFQMHPHTGSHIQRSAGPGNQPHFGQKILTSFMSGGGNLPVQSCRAKVR